MTDSDKMARELLDAASNAANTNEDNPVSAVAAFLARFKAEVAAEAVKPWRDAAKKAHRYPCGQHILYQGSASEFDSCPLCAALLAAHDTKEKP